jgi:prolipoprotein diacylglyceryl transferase
MRRRSGAARHARAVGFRLVALLSIPSPGDPFIVNSGPIHARWYGLLLALGVLLAGWIARREFRRRGMDPELAYTIAVWGVPAGLIGARLYHVLTAWDSFSNDYGQIPAIWNGGLSIFGAVLGGMLGVWIGCRRVRLPFWQVADCIAPGLVLAQALGRWGNYFNQELYGKPTDRPWGLEIDQSHRQAPYLNSPTFEPMFLFESLLNVCLFLVLVLFIRKWWNRVPYGTVFALYFGIYNLYRVPLETYKVDTADIFFVIGLVAFAILFHRRRSAPPPSSTATPVTGQPAVAGHTPTARPEAAIAARQRTKRRKRG